LDTTRLSDCWADLPAASVTFAENAEVPEADAVPEIAPEEEFNASPLGSEPEARLQP
jgi:hypothetical protein